MHETRRRVTLRAREAVGKGQGIAGHPERRAIETSGIRQHPHGSCSPATRTPFKAKRALFVQNPN